MKQVIISGAKSRSHLVYLASYLRPLVEASDGITAFFIPLPPFLNADAINLEDLRAALPDGIHLNEGLVGWDPRAETTYLCVGAPGLKVLRTLMKAMGSQVKNLHIVVTDEGIGSYGDFRTAMAARARQGAKLPVAAAKSAVGSIMRYVPARRWATFEKTHGRWVLNRHVVDEFVRYTGELGEKLRTAVILTQPFVDMGLIAEDAYLAYVNNLVEAAKQCGLHPVVRPHPAEHPGRYNDFEVMQDVGTAELDPQVLRAAVCLGGPSTALVNLAAMHHMPVVWSSAPGLEFLDTDMAPAQKDIFATFLGAPVGGTGVADAVRDRLEV